MHLLALGLFLFLGIHLTRALAPQWRAAQIARRGEMAWKLTYTLISLIGFGLILWGFRESRLQPVVLWPKLPGMNHLAALFTLFAFILMVAAYVPGNHLKVRLRHPMTLSVKVWALAHLLANNTAADLMLFGSFLVWSILVYRAARRRPEPAPRPGTMAGTAFTVVIGVAAWAGFAFWLHGAWIGVRPLG